MKTGKQNDEDSAGRIHTLPHIGVLLMFCNLLTAAFTVFAVTMRHLQILQEEHYLTAAFGAEYLKYRHQVLRYLGRRKG